MCNLKFVPNFFHLEKIKYELDFPSNGTKLHLSKHTNSDLKPSNVIRRSWITSCPKCSYIIRFAAEIGKKELAQPTKYSIEENLRRMFHKNEFKEQDQTYIYNFYTLEKPFKDIVYYSKELEEITQNKIKNSLDDLNLPVWGDLYKSWKKEEQIDSFKFLIRFFSNFEKFTDKFIEEPNEQDIIHKIHALSLPESIQNLLLKAYAIKSITVNDNYDLTEDDEMLIQGAFIQLVLELILQKLKPLKLNDIKSQGNYNGVDKDFYYSELKKFVHKYFKDLLGILNFDEDFFNPLLKSLKLPVNK